MVCFVDGRGVRAHLGCFWARRSRVSSGRLKPAERRARFYRPIAGVGGARWGSAFLPRGHLAARLFRRAKPLINTAPPIRHVRPRPRAEEGKLHFVFFLVCLVHELPPTDTIPASYRIRLRTGRSVVVIRCNIQTNWGTARRPCWPDVSATADGERRNKAGDVCSTTDTRRQKARRRDRSTL